MKGLSEAYYLEVDAYVRHWEDATINGEAVERLRREWVGESKAMTNQPEELMHESNNHPV